MVINALGGSASVSLPEYGFWGELDAALRTQLMVIGSRRTVAAGEYVIVQGQPNDDLSIILSGNLRVSCHANGNIVQLAVLEAGDVVGEMSVLDSGNASADVIVGEQSACLLTIAGEDLNALARLDPIAGFALMKALAPRTVPSAAAQ